MNKILEVNNLKNKIIDIDNFYLYDNEIVGIIGKSGIGKSTFAKCLLNIVDFNGEIKYFGIDIKSYSRIDLAKIVTIIFQDSSSSLNFDLKISEILNEPLEIHNKKDNIESILESVGIDKIYLDKYPHQLSQGQRQRVAIARALLLNPRIIICDEITSSLDAIVQTRIINLLIELKQKYKFSLIFISHNQNLINQICDRVYEFGK